MHAPKVGCICRVCFHRYSQANFLSKFCRDYCAEWATSISSTALKLSGELIFNLFREYSLPINDKYRGQRILRYFNLTEGIHHHLFDCSLQAAPHLPQVIYVKIFMKQRAYEVSISFPKIQLVSSVFSSALEEISRNIFCRQASYQTQQIYS